MGNAIKDLIGKTHEDKEVKIGEIQRLNDGRISLRLDMDVLKPMMSAFPDERFFMYAETDGDL